MYLRVLGLGVQTFKVLRGWLSRVEVVASLISCPATLNPKPSQSGRGFFLPSALIPHLRGHGELQVGSYTENPCGGTYNSI